METSAALLRLRAVEAVDSVCGVFGDADLDPGLIDEQIDGCDPVFCWSG